jgi:hypothetical protein
MRFCVSSASRLWAAEADIDLTGKVGRAVRSECGAISSMRHSAG